MGSGAPYNSEAIPHLAKDTQPHFLKVGVSEFAGPSTSREMDGAPNSRGSESGQASQENGAP